MTKLKITVLKKLNPKNVHEKEFFTPSGKTIPVCDIFEEEQEFICEGLVKPDKFCGWAWHDIYKDLSVLYFGGNFPWAEAGTAITCCTDGIRPVIFKLERVEED